MTGPARHLRIKDAPGIFDSISFAVSPEVTGVSVKKYTAAVKRWVHPLTTRKRCKL